MPTEDGQKLRHPCSTCARSFSTKRDLVKHQYMHREKPNLVCLHCSKTFTTESNYRRHINALQNVEKKGYNCGNCGSLFRRLRDLEQHHELKHRDDKVFRCKVCQAEFSWHENLLKHQQVHEANPHICTVCHHEFIDMTSLLVHRRTHHLPLSTAAAEQPQKGAGMVISQQQPETSSEKPFTCHICGRSFKFDFSYQAHLDAHVIPASKENSADVGQGCEPTLSHLSKPVYVQMDSEGIIYLPAFSSSANEDVEIIVEVRNVATPTAAAGTPISQQIPTTPDKDDKDGTTCMKSEKDKKPADNGELQRTSEDLKCEERKDDSSVAGINDDHKDQIALGCGSVERNGEDNVLRKADENDGPPEIDRMDDVVDDDGKPWPAAAVTSFHSYSTRPKKPTKRKRERVPFQFNCVMTDDKPFVCFTCGEAFRWEISLQVHTKVHTEGKVPGVRKIYNSAGAAVKRKVMKCEEKAKNNAAGEPGIKKSRIVYRRDSSDEEDMVEDMFAFGNDPEEVEGGSQVVALHHGKKKVSEKTLRPDNADDMLQEYLVGGNEGFISLEESNALAENEMEDCSLQAEGVLHNKLKEKHKTIRKKLSDDSWRKGKAILRKKRSWKPSKQRPEAQTDAIHSGEEESVGQQSVQSKTLSGGGEEGLAESLGNCDQTHEHNELDKQDVIDAEDEDKKKSCCPPYKVVEQGCLDEFRAVAEGDGGGGGTKVGLDDDRIAMATAYAAVAQPSAERGLLQNGIIKDELLMAAGAEQGEDALCLSVAMDTDCISQQETTASDQVRHVNACSSIALSGSMQDHQTDRRADDVVTGKMSPIVGECVVSVPHDIQQNVSVSVRIPLQSAEIEPHTMPASLIPSQGAEAEPPTTSAGLISSQGAEADTTISSSQLRENMSNATAYEFKHDDNCSVKICASAGNGEHAKDSMEDMHYFQPVIKEDVSVSTAVDLDVEQHCMTKEFCPAMTSSASATSMCEGKNALSPKPMTLDIIAGSIYSASSVSDQTLKDAALQRKYPFKQRNMMQVSHLFQSFKARCFSKKSLTLKKSVKGGSDVIPSNLPKSAHGTITNKCVRCGKHFTSDRSLKRHRMRHRSSVKIVSFKCSYCWKRFSTMASLDRHLISLHVPSVASCKTCHKQFTTLDSFTLHQRHGCVFTASIP